MNYTIRPINTGFIGGGGGKLEPGNFYDYHFSLFKLMEEKGGIAPRKRGGCVCFLLEGNGKKILADTGMWDTERADRYHHKGSIQDKGFAVYEQLDTLGIKPEDIDYVLLTHLHWDHVGFLAMFKNSIIIAHERELAFALDPIPLYYKSYEHPAIGIESDLKKVKIDTLSGETEILPGIISFDSPGHSPGHISFEVQTKEGKYILAGDSAFGLYSYEPVPELHYDVTPPGRFCDIVGYWNTLRETKDRAGSLDRILLTHESSLLDLMEKRPVLG
jgi:N-acyl homoserine lactone hydrolase